MRLREPTQELCYVDQRNMKNVTVTLEEDLARWARVKAAGEMKSLSRFIAILLEQKRRAEQPETGEKTPVQRFLEAIPEQNLGGRRFDRESLYDRKVLR